MFHFKWHIKRLAYSKKIWAKDFLTYAHYLSLDNIKLANQA